MKKLLLLITLLFTIGCANTKDDIVGKWHNDVTNIEFFKDGTVSMVKKGTPMTGTYSVLENDRLKMTITVMGMTMTRVAKIKLSDKELILTSEDDGKITKYSR